MTRVQRSLGTGAYHIDPRPHAVAVPAKIDEENSILSIDRPVDSVFAEILRQRYALQVGKRLDDGAEVGLEQENTGA